jgi:alpha-galactosidase
MIKIVIVGAGSVEFTRNLLADFLAYPELRDITVGLHDIDEDRLQTAERVARWTGQHFGAEPRIEASLDRTEILPGADFVINTVQVGGYPATQVDFDIPARYGIEYTIADTVGVGGVMRGLRSIPVMLEIAQQMERYCPQAWLLNYTNPMSMLVWAASKATPIKVLGLCHSVFWTIHGLAEWLGVPFEEIRYRTAGINHIAWVLALHRGDTDLYPLLRQKIEAGDIPEDDRVRAELCRRFGYFPTESSEHHAEYSPYFLGHPELVERLNIPLREYLRRCQVNLGEFEDTKSKLDRGEALDIEPTSEYAAEIIHTMLSAGTTEIVGNVMNEGRLIPNLQPEACVEVPCLVDGMGVHPTIADPLPVQCAALIHPLIDQQNLTVDAVLQRDREKIYQAVALDPVLAGRLTLDQIWQMTDELLQAEARWMPDWAAPAGLVANS